MEIVIISLVLLVLIIGGAWWWRKRDHVSRPQDTPIREHEDVYEMPTIRMTEAGDLTDSFMIEMKTLKKYRDAIINDENQE